jgi:hypothetical protein
MKGTYKVMSRLIKIVALAIALLTLSACAPRQPEPKTADVVADVNVSALEDENATVLSEDEPYCKLTEELSVIKLALAKLINERGIEVKAGKKLTSDENLNGALRDRINSYNDSITLDAEWINDPEIRKHGRFVLSIRDKNNGDKADDGDDTALAPIISILSAIDDLERRISSLEQDRAELLSAAGVKDGNTTKAIIALARNEALSAVENSAGKVGVTAPTQKTVTEKGVSSKNDQKDKFESAAGSSDDGVIVVVEENITDDPVLRQTNPSIQPKTIAGRVGGSSSIGGLQIALGDKPCTMNSPMCYVATAGVNVRLTPCAINKLAECKATRVRTYGETVLPLELRNGTKSPSSKFFRIGKDEWVIAYSLRELDPKLPPIVFAAQKQIDIVSGVMFNNNPKGDQMAFNGDIVGSIASGNTVLISGCALGWCKLYGRNGYIRHSDVEDEDFTTQTKTKE